MENTHAPIETNKFVKTRDRDNRAILNNKYKVIKRLAEGSFSVIKLVENINEHKFYALKQYNKTILQKKRELIRGKDGKVEYKDSFGDILREIQIMKKLNNPNVIKLHEIINDPEHHKLYLIIDYCEKGSVLDWNGDEKEFNSKTKDKYLPEPEIARILAQVIKGLEYLHGNKIVHRDLKPQNLLQSADGTIKIADFDIATEVDQNVVLNKTKGTLQFMAPELCKKNANLNDETIGYTADMWSLGVTLYCMTYMKLPFLGTSLIDLISAIETKPHFHIKSRQASEDLKDLIDRLMDKDPKTRITLEETKNHPFLTHNNGGLTSSECV